MCNRYTPGRAQAMAHFRQHGAGPIRDECHIGDPLSPGLVDIGPYGRGWFIRTRSDGSLEEVEGQWGLIGWFAKSAVPPRLPGRGGPILTNNARFETIAEKPTFQNPWRRGQRCIIPAWSYVEPNWESGRNQWWRFKRVDGQPWGMAGLWNTWVDRETGEVHESYTMVTLNADHHPLLRRMHRPDPDRPSDQQDKRAVVPLAPSLFEAWLKGTIEEATRALVLPSEGEFDAGPDASPPARKVAKRPPPPEQGTLL